MIANLTFDVVSFVLLASAILVVSSRNPVHAVLFLILAFLNAAVLFLLAGAEFLAFILAIVYVGAVAVLFLFVVMMLDVDFAAWREGLQRYAIAGTCVALILAGELVVIATGWKISSSATVIRLLPMPNDIGNTAALGSLIYTNYLPLFQLSAIILLVSMIGAIVLTHRDRKRAKVQNLATQHARNAADTLVMVSAKLNEGAPTPEKEAL